MNLSYLNSFKRGFFLFLTGLFVVLSVSCATMKAGSMKYPVYVTNTAVVDLLPPECMEGSLDTLDLLQGKFAQTTFSVQAYMQADSNGIFITLLNDFGTDMGNLSYTGEKLAFDSAVFPQSLKPQYIAADIQFAYYKADDVQTRLAGAGLGFICERHDDGTEVRRITAGRKVIEEITKASGSVKIVNSLRGYEYNLTEAQQ